MRVGTAIFLGLLALFGFGFFLAHSFNLSRELIEARDQLARLQAERQALEAQYQGLLAEQNRLTDQVSGLAGENENLRRRVDSLESERLLLASQIQTLQRKLGFAERGNPLFTWLVSGPYGRGIVALLIVPILPVSLGAAYIMTHRKATNPSTGPASGRRQDPTAIQALLTRDEFHLIARLRKSRTAGAHMRGLHETMQG